MFANAYLAKNNNSPLIDLQPDEGTGIIIVIPCLREPDIISTLESLGKCDRPLAKVEVIILINHSEIAPDDLKAFNRKTKMELDNWGERNRLAGIRYFPVGPLELKKKWAGAGLARKKGMDEALRRFNLLGKPDGIIVSLDADTLVQKNYLVEIENYFLQNEKAVGATIGFEHQKKGLEERQLQGINLYEQYLAYYKRALEFTGYPDAMFTIGSAFAVKVLAYLKRGGMNRRQAGEDFYFLQNLVQIGQVGEIDKTKVFPSARLSDRVPFGTGPVLKKWVEGREDLLQTYNFRAFCDLKQFFVTKDALYKIDESGFQKLLMEMPGSIQQFIIKDNFWTELSDLNKNCSTLYIFRKRFFQKFNAFKVLKYLNFAHEKWYKKADLGEQIFGLDQEQQA